jgi:Zn-dependent protease
MSDEALPPSLATPILDSGVLPSRRRRGSRVSTLVSGFAFAVGFTLIKSAGQQAHSGSSFGLGVLLLVVAFFLAVTVHELGHLIAGWALGFRFSSVSVGPFSLSLEYGALKVRVRQDMGALGYAGMRVDEVRRLRRRVLIYGAAGPAANLLSIPVTVLLVDYIFPELGKTWVASAGAQFVILSFLFGIVSLVPFGLRSRNDGARIAMLLGSRERARRWISLVAIDLQQSKGVRPKLWPRTWLKAASSVRDTSADEFYGNWVAYAAADDRKEESAAEAHLERCLELSSSLNPSIRDMAAQEAAVFSAWFRGDVPLADRWVSQLKKPRLMHPLQQIRLAVALHCGQNDFDTAIECWQEGAILIGKMPQTAAQAQLKKSWLEWQSEIQERQRRLASA